MPTVVRQLGAGNQLGAVGAAPFLQRVPASKALSYTERAGPN